VVAVYDLDEEHSLIAMELCAGGPLSAHLQRGPLRPLDALGRAAELFDTLVAVHQAGIVHGDVKPANLLYRGAPEDGDLVLGDFGVAHLAAPDGLEARAARGTLAYLAPEERHGHVSPAVDVYAAGVILLELLGGPAALSSWLGDRAALMRGEARWDGRLPEAARTALGPRAEPLATLAGALVDADPARRPAAADAARRLRALVDGSW
jgi:serine/threonine protein kinase